jgi:c-di-GMP-specific phosphodiesterase
MAEPLRAASPSTGRPSIVPGESSRRLWDAVRLAQIGSWLLDVDRRLLLCSPELHLLHGLEPRRGADGQYTSSEVSLSDWMDEATPADRGDMEAVIERVVRTGGPVDYEYQVKTGRATRWLAAHAEVGQTVDGRIVQIVGYTHDVTARRRTEERRRRTQRELAHQQRVLERIARGEPLEATLAGICRYVERQYPRSGCTVLLLDRAAGVLRHGACPTIDGEYAELIDGLPVGEGMAACGTAAARGDLVIVEDVQSDPLTTQFTEIGQRFNLRSVWSHPLRKAGGEVLGTFAVYRSEPHRPNRTEIRSVISVGTLAALAIERSRAESALQSAANLDALTGLPNRARFLELVNAELQDHERGIAVVSIELNRFTRISNSLGHLAGDRILSEVADRLRSVVAASGLVARFGEYEFTLMVAAEDMRPVRQLADRVLQAIETPIRLDGGEFFLSANIGIARNHDAAADAYSLVRDADAAMSAARAGGPGNHQVYDRRLRAQVIERLNWETELRHGIERGELVLHYQPILNLLDGRWSAVEALVRWEHPRRGLVGPDQFIPLAEETGLIVPLGESVLRMVAIQAKKWRKRIPGLQLAANTSVLQLADPNIADGLLTLLKESGLPPETLQLEVTESALMHELDNTRSTLEQLLDSGVTVLIDDFGTGYSSLARLGELPINGLKIDRQFTRTLGSDPAARQVVRAIAELASAHSLEVVAEGIEDAQALAHVKACGCQFAQGFHLGRPAPAHAVEARLTMPVPPDIGLTPCAA